MPRSAHRTRFHSREGSDCALPVLYQVQAFPYYRYTCRSFFSCQFCRPVLELGSSSYSTAVRPGHPRTLLVQYGRSSGRYMHGGLYSYSTDVLCPGSILQPSYVLWYGRTQPYGRSILHPYTAGIARACLAAPTSHPTPLENPVLLYAPISAYGAHS